MRNRKDAYRSDIEATPRRMKRAREPRDRNDGQRERISRGAEGLGHA
jgi:hypothetical protein